MRFANLSGRGGPRDVLIALMIAALVALSWSLVAEAARNALEPVRKYYPYILAYAYLIILLPPIFAGKRILTALTAVAGLVLAVFLATDLTTLRFFDTPFLQIYRHLPVTAENASPAALAGYAASYVPTGVWLLSGTTIILGLGASRGISDRSRARTTILLLLPLSYIAAVLINFAARPTDPKILALMDEPRGPLKHLSESGRGNHFTLEASVRAEPKTIILVIMESTGALTLSSDGTQLLSQKLIKDSKAGGWVNFPDAVTNSNATDISVPSLLTGSGAHEPVEKINALPFAWQYAAARGYRTAFITSSTMNWANFDTLLHNTHMDEVLAAEDSGLPFVNDLAVDDHYVYREASEMIGKADGKLFLTLYPQSLHWPFQADSAFAIPGTIKDRRARAVYIAESGFQQLFQSLRKAGRLDDALIIIAGDHGEFDYASTLRMPRMRLNTFDEGILSPIFMIKPSSAMSDVDRQALAGNRDSLVANLDITPTLADLLGGKLDKGLEYSGFSLFQAIPEDRIAYSTATNEWRHWANAAIAISQGKDRMTCDKIDLCSLSRANGAKLTFIRPVTPDDALFKLAIANPILREALGQIYRNHYR